MTQAAIISAAKRAIQQDKLQHLITLLSSGDEKPSSDTVSEILIYAVNNSKWPLIEEICLLDIENKAGEEAFLYTLQRAMHYGALESFKLICRQRLRPVSKATIDALLLKALGYNRQDVWHLIDYLCFLPFDNKPSQLIIDAALKKAVDNGEWVLAKKLYTMEGDNKPSEPAIAYALDKAWICKSFAVFTTICAESTIPPSQETIESLLSKALDGRDDRAWPYIDYLCLYPLRNKPRQPLIDKALKKATYYGQWVLAKKLYTMEGENKASEEAVADALGQAWVSNSFKEFSSICMESTTPPVTTTIESLLGRALASHDDKA